MNRSKLIETYTRFIFVENMPQKADILLIPGSPQKALAQKAAELYKQGYIPQILVSGRYSICQKKFILPENEKAGDDRKFATEAEYLEAVLLKQGVPKEAIWLEKEAMFTYENAIFSRKLLEKKKYPVKKALLCCKPSHARRCLLYYQLLFPETEFLVCPCAHEIRADNWYQTKEGIDTVLGEISRCGTQFGEILREDLENGEEKR